MVERRQFLGLALGALGGVIATPALSRFLSANQSRLSDRGPYIDRAVDAFSESLRAWLLPLPRLSYQPPIRRVRVRPMSVSSSN